ncbi:acetyltransferase [Myroides sp. C15-4]|uniref:acetyltransferase n=1 Tax=Myroides sp. C15-4 TaxID=3400532 RepID=UPI003D2F6EBA
MKKIAVFGAGGFGREVKTIIDSINQKEHTFEFIGFYDDGLEKGTIVNGYQVLGGVKELNKLEEEMALAIAIGDPKTKAKIVSLLSNSLLEYPNIISPHALISSDFVTLGKGNIICAGTIITCNIEIKDFIILNLSCTVGHDTVINNYASFMPSVNISGEVVIGEGVYVGTGAKIINLLDIGEYTIVGAGAVVAKTLPAKCTAVGIPAKPIKYHE